MLVLICYDGKRRENLRMKSKNFKGHVILLKNMRIIITYPEKFRKTPNEKPKVVFQTIDSL